MVSQQVRFQTNKRPVGVWLLTICNALFAGVFPIITAAVLMLGLTPVTLPGGILSGLLFGLLGAAVIAAAIGSWQGSDRARKALIGLVTAYYLLTSLNNLAVLLMGYAPPALQAQVGATIFRAIFWTAITIWYFSRPRVRDWFQR
jgi:hypothetical protein